MLHLQILGAGCPRCAALAQNVETAVSELGLEARVEKVTDMDVITRFAVMMTPALVINSKVELVGRVASVEEIKRLIASSG
jgi:small redox-active disulfide protein 2